MSDHFIDRLQAAVKARKAPVCVGIDPVYDRLPAAIRELPDFNDGNDAEAALDAILEFCRMVLKTVAPVVPAVKFNTSCFERYYGEGIDAYLELVQEAAGLDLLVIGDCKRGDVGHTGELYAAAHLADPGFQDMDHLLAPDAVTVHTYLGLDGLKPYLNVCRREGKGVFAIVQTSNESASEIQGFTNADGATLAEYIARLVNTWAGDDGLMGRGDYSCLGAVVAPRDAELCTHLRALMHRCWFLVPGYGAQGLPAENIARCFKPDGSGAIVTASRSIIYAYDNPRYEKQAASGWPAAVEAACRDMVAEIVRVANFSAGT